MKSAALEFGVKVVVNSAPPMLPYHCSPGAPPQPGMVAIMHSEINTVFEVPSLICPKVTPEVWGLTPGSKLCPRTTPKTPTPQGPAVESVPLPYMSPLPAQPE